MIEGAKAKKAVSFAPECCGQPYLQRSLNKHAKMAIAASPPGYGVRGFVGTRRVGLTSEGIEHQWRWLLWEIWRCGSNQCSHSRQSMYETLFLVRTDEEVAEEDVHG